MGLIDESKKEREAYDKPDERLMELSIQEALTILSVYVADLDPEDCQQAVEQIVKLMLKHPLFEEISENEQSTLERMDLHLNMMQNKDYEKKAVTRAIDVILPEEGETAYKLAVQIGKTLGLTESRKQNLNDLADKLSIDHSYALKIIQSG